MKFRFSLRAMLVAMTVAALMCLWRDRPRQIAGSFKSAFSRVAGLNEGLQLCGLQSIADIDRWTIRDVRVGEFKQSPGMAGWLLNHRVATLKIYVSDRDAGYGSTEGVISASAWGIDHQLNGNWQSELPPLLQWFLD
jgi:hypothetical protein